MSSISPTNQYTPDNEQFFSECYNLVIHYKNKTTTHSLISSIQTSIFQNIQNDFNHKKFSVYECYDPNGYPCQLGCLFENVLACQITNPHYIPTDGLQLICINLKTLATPLFIYLSEEKKTEFINNIDNSNKHSSTEIVILENPSNDQLIFTLSELNSFSISRPLITNDLFAYENQNEYEELLAATD